MAFLKVRNRAVSTLASGISDSDTSLTVATGEGSKFPASGDFHITIEDEILKCTARSGDVLTVTRAQEGTAAAAHIAGKAVELRITAAVLDQLKTIIQDADGDTAWEVEQSADEDKIHGKVAGVEAFLLSAVGELTLAKQSSARGYRATTDQTIASGSNIKVELNAESYDVQNEFDPTTNYRFTVKEAGKYAVAGIVGTSSIPDGTRLIVYIYKNDAAMASSQVTVGGAQFAGIGILDIVGLAANDYLDLRIFQDSGGDEAVRFGTQWTFMSVARVA